MSGPNDLLRVIAEVAPEMVTNKGRLALIVEDILADPYDSADPISWQVADRAEEEGLINND